MKLIGANKYKKKKSESAWSRHVSEQEMKHLISNTVMAKAN